MTILTVQPQSVSGDWTNASTGSLTDGSDSTYKIIDNAYQYGTMIFPTSGIPWSLGVVVRWVRVRLRARNGTGSGFTTPQIWLSTYNNSPRIILNSGVLNTRIGGTTFMDFYTTIPEATWTQDDGEFVQVLLNLPQLELPWTAGVAGTYWFSEAFLDIWYIKPPIATLSSPTGTYTTATNPSITWTYQQTDSDGSPQVAYQWAVYNDDQYNAVGFQPGVGTAVVESGIIYSTLKTAALTSPLPNDNYKAYIRVAQRTLGKLHWSQWASTTFVINVSPPAAPTVTPTADNTNARVKIAIVGAGSATSVQDVYEVQHSIDNGTTWEPVRGDAGTYVYAIGGARTFYDYETPNGVAAVWRARTISTDSYGNQLVGSWTTSSSATWTSSNTWLKVPTAPDLNRAINFRVLGPEDHPIPQGKFLGISSSKPITITGIRQSLPDIQIAIYAATDAEATAIKTILQRSEVLLVHSSSRVSGWKTKSRYISIGGVRITRIVNVSWPEAREVAMPATEVERPNPEVYPMILGTNTWDEISAAYASFTLMDAAFTTHGDVRG